MSASQESAGGMTIDLDMPPGNLDADVRKAEGILDRMSTKMGVVSGVAAAAGTLIGQYLGRGLMMARGAFEDAITHMDDLNDAALRIGVSVEKFSELEYAAKQTGGSIQGLETALRMLSNAMDDTASGKTTAAANAFKTLGVEVATSDGKLRASNEVLLDLADKFSNMEAGAKKTALAIDVFGKSGSGMIQMLDEGRGGLQKFIKEAHKFGSVVTDEAAAAANKWKDDTDLLNQKIEGLWRTIASALIPWINKLFVAISRASIKLQEWGSDISATMDLFVDTVKSGDPAIAWTKYLTVLDEVKKKHADMLAEFDASALADSILGQGKPTTTVEPPASVDATKAANEAKKEQLSIETAFLSIMDQQNAAAEYNNSIKAIEQQQIDKLNESRYLTIAQFAQLDQLLADGTINSQAYQEAISGLASTMDSEIENAANKIVSNLKRIEGFFKNVSNASASSWLAMGDTMVDTLGQVFGESKELAIAQALINTAQAVMATLAQYGGTPWGWAAAAAVAAMGAAQIAKIASTSKGGGHGSAAAVPAGSGTSSGSGGGAPGPSSQQTLFVQGIDPSQLYTGEAVRTLAESLLQYQRDGGRVVLSPGGGR